MHVGLNLVFLVPGEQGGMEVYARELLRALARERPDLRLTSFVSREARAAGGPWNEVGDVVEVPVNARSRVQWVRGEQQLLPGLARRAGVQLVHSLANTAPARGGFKRVVTIHDLHYRVIPDAHFGVLALGLRVLVPLGARRSDRVIAVSHDTGADVRRYLHVAADRVDVVPNGLGLTPADPAEPEAALRDRHALGARSMILSSSIAVCGVRRVSAGARPRSVTSRYTRDARRPEPRLPRPRRDRRHGDLCPRADRCARE